MQQVIVTIIACFVGYSLFMNFLGAIPGAAKAVVKSAVGKGSLSENLEYEFKGIGPFQIRIVEKNMWEERTPVLRITTSPAEAW